MDWDEYKSIAGEMDYFITHTNDIKNVVVEEMDDYDFEGHVVGVKALFPNGEELSFGHINDELEDFDVFGKYITTQYYYWGPKTQISKNPQEIIKLFKTGVYKKLDIDWKQ